MYSIHNDCEARNTATLTLEVNTKAAELMHNLLNICNLDYEWSVVDANKDKFQKQWDSMWKGPREIWQGFSDINTEINDKKVAKDTANYPFRAVESKKELNRVLEGETKNASGRHKFHDFVENRLAADRPKSRERFQNEPAKQWYSELEGQLYEDIV